MNDKCREAFESISDFIRKDNEWIVWQYAWQAAVEAAVEVCMVRKRGFNKYRRDFPERTKYRFEMAEGEAEACAESIKEELGVEE